MHRQPAACLLPCCLQGTGGQAFTTVRSWPARIDQHHGQSSSIYSRIGLQVLSQSSDRHNGKSDENTLLAIQREGRRARGRAIHLAYPDRCTLRLQQTNSRQACKYSFHGHNCQQQQEQQVPQKTDKARSLIPLSDLQYGTPFSDQFSEHGVDGLQTVGRLCQNLQSYLQPGLDLVAKFRTQDYL